MMTNGFTPVNNHSARIISDLLKRIDISDDCIVSQDLISIKYFLDSKPQEEMRYESALDMAWFGLFNGLLSKYEVDENGVKMYAITCIPKTDRFGTNFYVNTERETSVLPFKFASYRDRAKQIKRWVASYLYQYGDADIMKGVVIEMFPTTHTQNIA